MCVGYIYVGLMLDSFYSANLRPFSNYLVSLHPRDGPRVRKIGTKNVYLKLCARKA